MTDQPGDPHKVVVITLTARQLEDAPLVLVGGHPVPAERVSYDLVPSPEELAQVRSLHAVERAPQRKAVLTLTADPDKVTGEHTQIAARPARPHSTPILGPDGYAHADDRVRKTLTVHRTERGVSLAIAGDHHAQWLEVDAREVHALAAELIATLSRPAP